MTGSRVPPPSRAGAPRAVKGEVEYECPMCEVTCPVDDVSRVGEEIYCVACGSELRVLAIQGTRLRVSADE